MGLGRVGEGHVCFLRERLDRDRATSGKRERLARGRGESCIRGAVIAYRGQVELSRLQMQCFKGAWISNVLHDGIGIPRLVDPGGSDTITDGKLGDTNAEAERRAREKGLLADKPRKSHFQSMDEVGETAISWTLGKMVIEASRAVQPRSAAVEKAWASKLHMLGLSLDRFEAKLDSLGIQALWAYVFTAFVLGSCLFGWLKRRSQNGAAARRGRKPSVSGDSPLSSGNGWWTAALRFNDDSPGYTSLEDGPDPVSTRSSPRTTFGRLSIWTLRLGRALGRNIPFGPHRNRRAARHASLPMTNTYSTPLQSGGRTPSFSQPASPKASYFTPMTHSISAVGALTVPSTRPGSVSPELRASASSVSLNAASHHSPMATPEPLTSPRKGQGARPPRSRTNSNNGTYPLSLGRSGAEGAGWNDPPAAMLGTNGHHGHAHAHAHGHGLGHETVNLTPSVNGGFERTLSRQSSRVNLNDIGMIQRSASRAGTPRQEHQSP